VGNIFATGDDDFAERPMRKLAITLAAAAASLGFAAPASATWYPQPAYGYGYGHNYGYGYHNPYALARSLQYRIDRLQREIARQYRMISRGEYFDLRSDSREIERRLFYSARFGLNPHEAYVLQRQIARLEYKIARDVRDGRRWAYRW
jgi:hypothetical protein